MSSGKQTRNEREGDAPRKPLFNERQVLVIWGILLLAGWTLILNKNQWGLSPFFISPGAVFMCIAWVGVLGATYFLWRSGMTAASESDVDEEAYWRPVGKRTELESEKKTLLKAIKEIEFDHNLGKMSDADAKMLTQVYRQRAIAVIKAIDELGDEDAASASLRDKIDRDVKARLEVATATKKKKKKKKKAKASKSEAAS